MQLSVQDQRDFPVGWTAWLPDRNHDFTTTPTPIRDDPTDPNNAMTVVQGAILLKRVHTQLS